MKGPGLSSMVNNAGLIPNHTIDLVIIQNTACGSTLSVPLRMLEAAKFICCYVNLTAFNMAGGQRSSKASLSFWTQAGPKLLFCFNALHSCPCNCHIIHVRTNVLSSKRKANLALHRVILICTS